MGEYEFLTCIACGEEKHRDEFGPCNRKRSGKTGKCRVCAAAYIKAWADDNREHVIAQGWEAHLRKKYGISVDQYDRAVERQEGRCLLCLEKIPPFTGKRRGTTTKGLVVDHDHGSGRVRGLLCRFCNNAISRMDMFPGWNDRAAEYIARDFDMRST